jgi:hypothetical protein
MFGEPIGDDCIRRLIVGKPRTQLHCSAIFSPIDDHRPLSPWRPAPGDSVAGFQSGIQDRGSLGTRASVLGFCVGRCGNGSWPRMTRLEGLYTKPIYEKEASGSRRYRRRQADGCTARSLYRPFLEANPPEPLRLRGRDRSWKLDLLDPDFFDLQCYGFGTIHRGIFVSGD